VPHELQRSNGAGTGLDPISVMPAHDNCHERDKNCGLIAPFEMLEPVQQSALKDWNVSNKWE